MLPKVRSNAVFQAKVILFGKSYFDIVYLTCIVFLTQNFLLLLSNEDVTLFTSIFYFTKFVLILLSLNIRLVSIIMRI